MPWLELQGKLRLGPGNPGSESSADSLGCVALLCLCPSLLMQFP